MTTQSLFAARQLERELKLHARVLQAQVDGLSHGDSLIQPPDGGNCLNWLLGHIIVSRSTSLKLLGLELLAGDADYDRYNRNSDPLTQAEQALPLTRMLVDFGETQTRMLARLAELGEDDLAAIPPGQERTVAEQLSFLSWHETYHVGQLEQLRRLAGKTEKVI